MSKTFYYRFMNLGELQNYKEVQAVARETIEFLKSYIKEGVTEKKIKDSSEKFLRKKGIDSFWYYGVGAFVFVGRRTTISISGREYQASDAVVQNNDLVTVDLSPEKDGFWGDFARSFTVENGEVVKSSPLKNTLKFPHK
jgi:methionine aminopeptidase